MRDFDQLTDVQLGQKIRQFQQYEDPMRLELLRVSGIQFPNNINRMFEVSDEELGRTQRIVLQEVRNVTTSMRGNLTESQQRELRLFGQSEIRHREEENMGVEQFMQRFMNQLQGVRSDFNGEGTDLGNRLGGNTELTREDALRHRAERPNGRLN